MPGKPGRPGASTTRAPLAADTTHVLHFGHYCGASRLDQLRGRGLWVLMTAANYRDGDAHSGRPDWDWEIDAPKKTPARNLDAWVSAKTGYPVQLTRSDKILDPGWGSVIGYEVRQARREDPDAR